MEELDHPKWFCKHCMGFTDHTDIKEAMKSFDSLVLSGECADCKRSNLNYFPKLKRNPIFGMGEVDSIT